eukprot:jgi/Antlo1/2557/2098
MSTEMYSHVLIREPSYKPIVPDDDTVLLDFSVSKTQIIAICSR